jgi:hypothetical protein
MSAIERGNERALSSGKCHSKERLSASVFISYGSCICDSHICNPLKIKNMWTFFKDLIHAAQYTQPQVWK